MPVRADDDPRGVRTAFLDAAGHLVALVARLRPVELDAPATTAWSLRELVAHAGRAFVATEAVVRAEVDPSTPWLASAADYYRAAFAIPGVHAGIVERARSAATAVAGGDVAAVLRADLDRVAPLVASTPMSREVQHAAGRLAFSSYLETRVCELVLHAADVELAIGRPPTAPAGAAVLVRDVLVELADRADPLLLACVLAGRAVGGVDVLR